LVCVKLYGAHDIEATQVVYPPNLDSRGFVILALVRVKSLAQGAVATKWPSHSIAKKWFDDLPPAETADWELVKAQFKVYWLKDHCRNDREEEKEINC
jgi:hypothetical protein